MAIFGRYVVDVSARSLELLCEDFGDTKANAEFNTIMHTVLGVAEQVLAYCDLARLAVTWLDLS
jgi:hypothetical protein